jgi:hypothetical protein
LEDKDVVVVEATVANDEKKKEKTDFGGAGAARGGGDEWVKPRRWAVVRMSRPDQRNADRMLYAAR